MWAPLGKLFAPPSDPSWLRAWWHLGNFSADWRFRLVSRSWKPIESMWKNLFKGSKQ